MSRVSPAELEWEAMDRYDQDTLDTCKKFLKTKEEMVRHQRSYKNNPGMSKAMKSRILEGEKSHSQPLYFYKSEMLTRHRSHTRMMP